VQIGQVTALSYSFLPGFPISCVLQTSPSAGCLVKREVVFL